MTASLGPSAQLVRVVLSASGRLQGLGPRMSRPRQPPSEFLAQVLTRRGSPDDLPYPNEAVWIIRQHVLDAVQVL